MTPKEKRAKERELDQMSLELFETKNAWRKIMREGFIEYQTRPNGQRVGIRSAATMEDIEEFMTNLKTKLEEHQNAQNSKEQEENVSGHEDVAGSDSGTSGQE